MSTFFNVLLITLITSVITSSIIITSVIKSLKKKYDDMLTIMYRDLRYNENLSNRVSDTSDMIEQIDSKLIILSTSVNRVVDENEKNRAKKHLPTPEIADKIRKTMQDHIDIELTLEKNTKVPPQDGPRKVIDYVVQTYPDIDEEYIVRLFNAITRM